MEMFANEEEDVILDPSNDDDDDKEGGRGWGVRARIRIRRGGRLI